MKTPRIDPEFKAIIPAPTEAQFAELERSIVALGRARDPLVTWRGVLVDGHNRLAICQKHRLPYTVIEMQFPSRRAVGDWIVTNAIARRNLTPDQIVMLRAIQGLSTVTPSSPIAVRQAHELLTDGPLTESVRNGNLSIRCAYHDMLRARGIAPTRRSGAPRFVAEQALIAAVLTWADGGTVGALRAAVREYRRVIGGTAP